MEEAALLVDLYAADRKFSEYYNVLNPFFASHVCVLAQVSTYSSSLSEVLQELFTRALALKKKIPCLPCPFSPCSVETYLRVGLVCVSKGTGADLRDSIEAYQGVQIATST